MSVTVDQRMLALEAANEVRSQTAAFKRRLRDEGVAAVIEAIETQPAFLRNFTVFHLLTMTPFFGEEKLRRLNGRAIADWVNLAVSLGRMSSRSRGWLVRELSDWDAGRSRRRARGLEAA